MHEFDCHVSVNKLISEVVKELNDIESAQGLDHKHSLLFVRFSQVGKHPSKLLHKRKCNVPGHLLV